MHPKGANNMAASGQLGWHWEGHFYPFWYKQTELETSDLTLQGLLFPEFKARFSATVGWHFSRDLARRLLIGGCGRSNFLLSMTEITSESSFEPNKPTEQKLGYV